ncbi:MAG: proton-conducting transporter membrane subunit [Chloroflexota bacterium]
MQTLAAALVAFVQDDLRHAVSCITIADLGLVILAIAALDTAVWGPARAWLLTVAVTKTALAAWAAVAEDRFGTRSVPELRGWLRPSPVLGLALVLTVIASLGLPGWAVMTARLELAGRAASGPWDALLLVASMLTLPAYVRWLWIGIGAPTTHVDQAIPEFAGLGRLPARRLGAMPPSTRRDAGLPVEQEGAMGSAFAAPSVSAPAPDARESDAEPFRPASSGDVRPGTGVGARGRPARRSSSVAMAASAPEAAATAPLALLESEAAPDAETLPRRAARRSSGGAGSTANAAEMIKRHRTRLLSGAVLALALLASVVAFGGFDVARAAGELGPAVTGMESVGN